MTEFETRVLDLVSKIPAGKVTTYKELAVALGRPRACRAVANVLAGNPHPIEIPCHRVVKSNGKIGGYRLGENRKAELLSREGIFVKNGKIDLQKILFKCQNRSIHRSK